MIYTALALITLQGFCQVDSLNFGPEPIGGLNQVAVEYYKIDFTKEQREILEEVELEFIYSISEEGIPSLEKINGISDKAILDSLRQKTNDLPRFYPRRVNGIRENSVYFMKLQFPKYEVANFNSTTTYQNTFRYKRARYEDFEYIHKSGDRLDILIGGVTNFFTGKPADYLEMGGGMKMDLMYMGKKGIGGSLVMSFYGNDLKQDFPIASSREQNTAPPTLLIGLGINKSLFKTERTEFIGQVELQYAVQNITPRLEEVDHDFTQFQGFSPGIVGNYVIQLGRNKASLYYGSPTLFTHNLNLHAAIRPMFFNFKEATGMMFELGISYRIAFFFVDEFRLKPEFFNY